MTDLWFAHPQNRSAAGFVPSPADRRRQPGSSNMDASPESSSDQLLHPGLFNALYMNLIDWSAAMPPIARLYRVLATFSARLKRRMLAANERILAKTPGFLRIREASSAKLPSRT